MLRKILFGVLIAFTGVLLVSIGFLGRMFVERPNDKAVDQDFAILSEIAKVLGQDFVQPELATAPHLRDGAIEGIFAALEDSHSQYFDPEEYSLQRTDLDGSFEGIGATVAQQGDWLVIVQPLPDSPAEKAGIKAGDLILSVDGESAKGWSSQQGVGRIRGLSGTTVKLGIKHTDGREETLSIKRAPITQASVITVPPGPGGKLTNSTGAEVTDYAYIRIRSFTRSTPGEMEKALTAVGSSKAKGIILDLRGNPGGLLKETIDIADMFLESGDILTQVDRDGGKQTASAKPGVLTKLPVVILQDQFSASGSEVLAAAIKENNRGTIVGTRSFGKGTVNHFRTLSNGGAVYVSIARWLTPSGNQIEANGVQPNILVAPTQDDIQAKRDIWAFKAIDSLRAAAH